MSSPFANPACDALQVAVPLLAHAIRQEWAWDGCLLHGSSGNIRCRVKRLVTVLARLGACDFDTMQQQRKLT